MKNRERQNGSPGRRTSTKQACQAPTRGAGVVGCDPDRHGWPGLGPGSPLGTPAAAFQPTPLAGALLADSILAGLRAAAPVAFCLAVSTALVAILGRAMPVVGSLGLGIGVNLIVLLFVSCLSVEVIATAYQQSWSAGIDRIVAVWAGPQEAADE